MHEYVLVRTKKRKRVCVTKKRERVCECERKSVHGIESEKRKKVRVCLLKKAKKYIKSRSQLSVATYRKVFSRISQAEPINIKNYPFLFEV